MARLTVDGDDLRQPPQAQFELEGWIDTAPFEDLVGLKIQAAAGGKAVLTLPFRVKLAMGGGFMHGGAMTTLADTAVAMAIKSLLPSGTIFATTELTTRFLAPVKQGLVTATAVVRGPERRSFYGEATITDESGIEVALFSSVFRVARGQGFDD
jgi:uncharacterized protein (TIGR00369 family)